LLQQVFPPSLPCQEYWKIEIGSGEANQLAVGRIEQDSEGNPRRRS